MAGTVTTGDTMNKYWWIYLLQGVLAILLAIALFFLPGPTLLFLVTLLGIYWLIVGVFHIVGAFTGEQDQHRSGMLVTGALGIIGGLLVLARPLIVSVLLPTVFVILIGINGVLIGAVGLVQAFRGGGWGPGIWGVVSIVLGLLVILNPLIVLSLLPWIVGGFAILGGLTLIVMALRLRPR